MDPTIRTYDPQKCQIILGTSPVSGFADGSFVTVEQDGESFVDKAGADGEVARARKADRRGTMKLTLLATSIFNVIMTALHAVETPFPVLIKEGGTTVFSTKGWVQKPAAFERGAEISDAEWTVRLARVEFIHGGNP